MNKTKFLKKLNRQLHPLRRSERKRYLADYEEMISELTEHGMTENEAILKLGDVKQIAHEILSTSEKKFHWIDWKGKGLIVISILFVVSAFVTYQESHGFALHIGGGDGPTSIFIAGKTSNGMGIYILAAIFVGVTLLYLFWKKKAE